MKQIFTLSASLLLVLSLSAQSVIDGTFAFDTDPAKAYSLYIPSSYEEATPNRLVIGFHPLNTARWDAQSWRDTLIVFAESAGVILACPDGGADGAVDDPIDTAFTTALMDSVANWYNIDSDKVYAMGFSWGGRTTYTYALARPATFKGLIPIGAAINGTTEVNASLQANAADKPVYIVHGATDLAASRFFPVRDALLAAGALLEDTLMPGVGHTIDFADRNSILLEAFRWVDSVNCVDGSPPPNGIFTPLQWAFELEQNLLQAGTPIRIETSGIVPSALQISLWDVQGKQIWQKPFVEGEYYPTAGLASGQYLIRLSSEESAGTRRFTVH